MSRGGAHRANRPRGRRRLKAHTILCGAIVASLLAGQAISSAAWRSSSSSAGIRQVQAATLPSAGAPTAAQVAGGKTVRLSWNAVTFATSYEIRHYTASTGGSATIACASTGTTCVDPVARTGSNHWYSVVARAGTRWMSESTRTPYSADDATTVSITALGSDTGASVTDFITKTAGNTVTGSAEANASISVKRGGVQIATATANGSGLWTSTALNLTEGLQNLEAVATDTFGNTATATKVGVRLDTIAPSTSQSASCTAPGNAAPTGLWCKRTSLTMAAAFSDAGSGLHAATSQYNNNGAGWTAYTGAVSLAEGNGRVVDVRATDIAGNTGTMSQTYYIDGTAPTLVVTAPTPGLSLSVAQLGSLLNSSCAGNLGCGTSTDATSGLAAVSSVKWKLNKGSTCYTATGTTSCTGYAFQVAGGTLPNWRVPRSYVGFYSSFSTYTFSAQSTDRAGNASTVSFTYSTLK